MRIKSNKILVAITTCSVIQWYRVVTPKRIQGDNYNRYNKMLNHPPEMGYQNISLLLRFHRLAAANNFTCINATTDLVY
jgi:hypothetical protein